ncbi:MAG: hypothetical protein ACLR13_02470 [Acutalibacteraceae bacterium]
MRNKREGVWNITDVIIVGTGGQGFFGVTAQRITYLDNKRQSGTQ